MADPISSLTDHCLTDRVDPSTVALNEVHPFSMFQIAAWPDTFAKVGEMVGEWSAADPQGSLLRVEPLKWWLVSEGPTAALPDVVDEDGAVLDLSHSRTWIRITGERGQTLLNHFLPLDLRDDVFPDGSVAATAFHHVGVNLWRDAGAYNLLIPRSFARSLVEILTETARQYQDESGVSRGQSRT